MLKEAYAYMKEAGFFERLLKEGVSLSGVKKGVGALMKSKGGTGSAARTSIKGTKVKKFSLRMEKGKGLTMSPSGG